MTEETAQDAPAAENAPAATVPDTANEARVDEVRADGARDDQVASAAEPPARAPRRRRAPKQDPLLVADVGTARAGVEEIADPAEIGSGHRVVVEEDRLVVHLFECTRPGYRGWNWFASLARAPRSRAVTVCEVGLLPGDEALLAPEWVPWSERVSAEERAEEKAQEEDAAGEGAEDAADPAGDEAGERAEDRADGAGDGAEGTGNTSAGRTESAAEGHDADAPDASAPAADARPDGTAGAPADGTASASRDGERS
ncbi:DUF3027 domain-containing protein [Kocuria sp. M1R5S2]|uniref:DUF3027 domain-containing protein n=1 Tax=Kocuria rhizosphaerae TaxID=3376285 RepID=UPI003794BAFC